MSRIEGCPHVAIVMARFKNAKGEIVNGGEWSDNDVKGYVCMRCGFPMMAAPVRKFKNNPEATKFFAKIQEEYQLDLPSVGPKLPPGQPEDLTCTPQ